MYIYQCFAIILASDVSDVCEAENKATESCDCSQCSETDNTAAIIGGVVVAVALIVAVTTVIVILGIVALVLRSRSGSYSTSKTRQVTTKHTHIHTHTCRVHHLALCREATDVPAATNQTLELSKFSDATYE